MRRYAVSFVLWVCMSLPVPASDWFGITMPLHIQLGSRIAADRDSKTEKRALVYFPISKSLGIDLDAKDAPKSHPQFAHFTSFLPFRDSE